MGQNFIGCDREQELLLPPSLREAKRRLEEQRAAEARPIPRSRPDRLRESKRRLEEEHQVECQANADYEATMGSSSAALVSRDANRGLSRHVDAQPCINPAARARLDADGGSARNSRE
jgi:hypothetical protein